MTTTTDYTDSPDDYAPGPCRSLMTNGQWTAPENERPRDWREREQPTGDAPLAPKMRPTKPIGDFPRVGRPRATTMTLEEVRAHVSSGKTCREIAVLAGCKIGVIVKMRRKLNIVKTCKLCNAKPAEGSPQSEYCNACRPLARKANQALAKNAREVA